MILEAAQGMALLILSLIAMFVLLGILVVVHKQTARMKDIEMRMNTMNTTKEATADTAKGEVK
jgi:uncharacterized membrane protein